MIRLLAFLVLFSASAFAEAPRVYLTKNYSQYFRAGPPKFKKCFFYDNSVTVATKTGTRGFWRYRTRSTIYGHYYLNSLLVLANYRPLKQENIGVCDGPSVTVYGVRASGNRFVLKRAIDCTGKVFTRQGDAAQRLMNVVNQYCPNPN